MKIATFSIVAGTEACNARCPFCVSAMTPVQGVGLNQTKPVWRNFLKGAKLAEIHNVSTVLITGKGEPTLFPNEISEYLEILYNKFSFPIIELQTNGIAFADNWKKYKPFLEKWYKLGLSTIAISVVSVVAEENRAVYVPHRSSYPDLEKTLERLHDLGFSTRLSVVMLKDHIDNPDSVKTVINYAKEHNVTQVTLRPVAVPTETRNLQVSSWTENNLVSEKNLEKIVEFLNTYGTPVMTLPHGAVVFDFEDQNVCLTDCLTIESDADDLRQLIFFPDGHLRYDWVYPGAVLL